MPDESRHHTSPQRTLHVRGWRVSTGETKHEDLSSVWSCLGRPRGNLRLRCLSPSCPNTTSTGSKTRQRQTLGFAIQTRRWGSRPAQSRSPAPPHRSHVAGHRSWSGSSGHCVSFSLPCFWVHRNNRRPGWQLVRPHHDRPYVNWVSSNCCLSFPTVSAVAQPEAPPPTAPQGSSLTNHSNPMRWRSPGLRSGFRPDPSLPKRLPSGVQSKATQPATPIGVSNSVFNGSRPRSSGDRATASQGRKLGAARRSPSKYLAQPSRYDGHTRTWGQHRAC